MKKQQYQQRRLRDSNLRAMACLVFIDKFMVEKGYSPSIREIGDGADVSSTSMVFGYLHKLVVWKFITPPVYGTARTLRVTDEGREAAKRFAGNPAREDDDGKIC